TVSEVLEIGARAGAAARRLATTSSAVKDGALAAIASALVERADEILDANTEDLDRAEADAVAAALIDRLMLTPERVSAMAEGLRVVTGLKDPVGEVLDGWTLPNGLRITKVRVPLGVVGIIYEARPNVTVDAAGLCIKSGNACILRGSRVAMSSNIALARVIAEAGTSAGLPPDAAQLI